MLFLLPTLPAQQSEPAPIQLFSAHSRIINTFEAGNRRLNLANRLRNGIVFARNAKIVILIVSRRECCCRRFLHIRIHMNALRERGIACRLFRCIPLGGHFCGEARAHCPSLPSTPVHNSFISAAFELRQCAAHRLSLSPRRKRASLSRPNEENSNESDTLILRFARLGHEQPLDRFSALVLEKFGQVHYFHAPTFSLLALGSRAKRLSSPRIQIGGCN